MSYDYLQSKVQTAVCVLARGEGGTLRERLQHAWLNEGLAAALSPEHCSGISALESMVRDLEARLTAALNDVSRTQAELEEVVGDLVDLHLCLTRHLTLDELKDYFAE